MGQVRVAWALVVCVLLSGMTGIESAGAQQASSTVLASEIGETLELEPRLEFLRDDGGDLMVSDAQALAARGAFRSLSDTRLQFGSTDTVYWVHFRLQNDVERTHWLLFLPHQRVGRLDSYLFVDGELRHQSTSGFLVPTDRELPTNRIPLAPIHVNTGEVADIFLRVENVYVLALPLRLASDPAFSSWNRRDELVFGSTLGMLFAALIYLFGSWRLVPTSALGALSGYVVFCASFIAVSSGFTRDFVGFLGAWPTTSLINVSVLGIWICALLFGRQFLSTARELPKIDLLMRAAVAICLLALPLAVVFVSPVRVALVALINPLVLILLVSAGVLAVRKEMPGASAYLAAGLALVIGAMMRNLIDLDLMPLNELTSNGLFVGFASSALILSLAISEKIRQQQLESEARNRAIVSSSINGIVSLYPDGEIIEFNPRAEAIFGYSRSYALGKSIWDLLIPESDRATYHDRLERFLDSTNEDGSLQGTRVELTGRRFDNSTFPMEVAMAPGRLKETEFFTAHIRDLTNEKALEKELEQKREALAQSEKLGALGSLLAGVAHELNNPLSVIVGRSSMLRDLSGDERTKSMADKIYDAAQRCARIIRTFLAMARQRPQERRVANLNDAVDAAVELVIYNLRAEGIELSIDADPALPETLADSDQIIQVLVNLIVNAQHALRDIPGERKLAVRTMFIASSDSIVITVDDNGPGISEGIRSRIFDPFFTTKPVGSGTGLGLSVSSGMVESHGGMLAIGESQLGGACFVITLPRVSAEAESDRPEAAPVETIQDLYLLIVDDEKESGEALGEMMRPHGIQYHLETSADRALELLNDTHFDLIVSDMKMPGMSGEDFYREVAARHTHYLDRMIFVTGDVIGPEIDEFRTAHDVTVLEKPVSAATFAKAVLEAMQNRSSPGKVRVA